jgi:hypothetical protein
MLAIVVPPAGLGPGTGTLRIAVSSLDRSNGTVTLVLSGAYVGASGSGDLACVPSVSELGGLKLTTLTVLLPPGTLKGKSVVGSCSTVV